MKSISHKSRLIRKLNFKQTPLHLYFSTNIRVLFNLSIEWTKRLISLAPSKPKQVIRNNSKRQEFNKLQVFNLLTRTATVAAFSRKLIYFFQDRSRIKQMRFHTYSRIIPGWVCSDWRERINEPRSGLIKKLQMNIEFYSRLWVILFFFCLIGEGSVAEFAMIGFCL